MTQRRHSGLGALALLALMLMLTAAPGAAQDVREAARKAEAERAAAAARAHEVAQRILGDRRALTARVDSLAAAERALEAELTRLEAAIATEEKQVAGLETRWSDLEVNFRELSGNVRVAARDMEPLLVQSPMTALVPDRLAPLQPLLTDGYFPGVDDITAMAGLCLDEIQRSGQVGFAPGSFVGRDGEERQGRILTLGRFTAAYREGEEAGFLVYKPESQRFYALSALPTGAVGRSLKRYTAGQSDTAPLDLSGGAALRQVTRSSSVVEDFLVGGPVMWPILLVGAAAVLLIIFKAFFLNKVQGNTGKYMPRFTGLAAEGDWAEAEALVKRHKGEGSPVNHVLEAGLKARHEDRETLESILQEAILRELPRVERGLSVLAVLGAVAPLLGLLGTVTGMIDVFRVITLYGTGDPKLMSSGISEALITTEWGLVIAIPVMLAHVFLTRRADHIIGKMEEHAVSLTNTIEKQRVRDERRVMANA
jgi:biopolymer transport protein ExbB